MSKFLTYEDRLVIAQLLQENVSFGVIGKMLGKDRTTIAKEIKKHSYDKKSGRPGYPYNPCKHRSTCKAKKLCGNSCTHQSAYKCSLCSDCTLHCPDFAEDICSVKTKPPYADEFMAALDKDFKKNYSSDSEDDSVGATAEDIIENTADFILKELSRKLKGYDLENFVADLLRAMGYRTKVSPQGGDSGIDITAYKDELPPRILVQVKNQNGDINETTIQSLKGAMREGDYGLFVTLSNYTKNAQKYLESTPIIRGINGTELVDLILKYYEDLSEKYRKMIPLKKVYIPVSKEE